MKSNAIFVGNTRPALSYGMTGVFVHQPEFDRVNGRFSVFMPDGDGLPPVVVNRSDVYIPSKHQTRHCPSK